MLWTDGVFITSKDLMRIDSEVLKISANEDINLDGDSGMLRGAIEEASSELQKYVIAFGGYLNAGDLSANHLAAVLNVGIGNSVRQKILLQQVCVSGESSTSWNWIKEWVVFWGLKNFYRDAFSRLTNDRYEKKMLSYKDEIQRRLLGNIYGLGIPVVLQPLSTPGAIFERDSGTWGPENISMFPASPTPGANGVDVTITYVDMSQPNRYAGPTKPNNAESQPGVVQTVYPSTTPVQQSIVIDISSLNPPTGVQSMSTMLICVIAPLIATHWNVYAGNTGGTLYLQNASPIPIDTTSYTIPSLTLSGYRVGFGQYPTRRLSVVPTRQRA